MPAGLHHAAGTDDDAGLLPAVQLLAALAVLHELPPPETEGSGPRSFSRTREELGTVAHHLGGVDGQGLSTATGMLACSLALLVTATTLRLPTLKAG